MKISRLMVMISVTVLSHAISADDVDNNVLGFCDQQLIQASIRCTESEKLEQCIRDSLAEVDCKMEVSDETDVDMCNEECAPDLTAIQGEENNLSLTEGE